MVTMVTTPKSAGVNSRARMTVLITWTARPSPEADIVAAAPLTARRPQFVASSDRAEGATSVKWDHSLAQVELSITGIL